MSNQLFIEKLEGLRQEEKYEEAIELANKLICKDPSFAQAYEELGDVFLCQKELTKAEKALLYAVKLDPTSTNAHYLLGFCYGASGRYEESVASLKVADGLWPNNPEVLRCLGWSIFQVSAGKRKEGIEVLERAVALRPMDVLTMTDLGVCYLTDRQFEPATSILTEALKLSPDDERIKEALENAEFFKIQFQKLDQRDYGLLPPREIFEGPPPEDLATTL